MLSKIPNQLTAKTTLTQEIEGMPFDFTLTFTPFGEVLAVENDFLQLPEEAQRLTLGTKWEKIITLIKVYDRQFHFILPLVALRLLWESKWYYVQKEMDAKRAQITTVNTFEKRPIKEEWVRRVWELSEDPDGPEKLMILKGILVGKENQFVEAIAAIDQKIAPLTEPLLLNLLPLHAGNRIQLQLIYKFLGVSQSDQVLKLLSEELSNEDLQGYHSAILHGLSHFKDQALRRQLLDYDRDHPQMNSRCMRALLFALQPYNDLEVRAIFIREYSGKYPTTCKITNETLSRMGWPIYEQRRVLLSTLEARESVAHVRTALTHCLDFEDDAHVPTAELLQEVLEWGGEKNAPMDMIGMIGKLLRRKIDEHTNVNIPVLRLLNKESPSVRRAAVKVLSETGDYHQIDALLRLLEDPDRQVQKETLQALRKFLAKYNVPKAISPLLKCLKQDDINLKIGALLSMSYVIVIPAAYDLATPPLLAELKHPNPIIRRLSTGIIAFIDKEEVRIAIKEMLQDPDKEVREVAKKALSTQLDVRKAIKKKKKPANSGCLGSMLLLLVLICWICLH